MKQTGVFLILVVLSVTVLEAKPNTYHIRSVKDFELQKYLGTWFEIARLPHFFEKNLQQVTATYTLLENGKIEVLNKGYNTKKEKWVESIGKASIPDKDNPSELKVSFFWPFSSAYRIIYLKEDYSVAIVTSKTFDYFWLLSRSPHIKDEYYKELISKAADWGFDTEKMIKVDQGMNLR